MIFQSAFEAGGPVRKNFYLIALPVPSAAIPTVKMERPPKGGANRKRPKYKRDRLHASPTYAKWSATLLA